MHIQELIKEALTDHKQKIELTQWAIISAVSSLVYSEYIKNITQKQVPVSMVLVPSIKTVNELLEENGSFMKMISDNLIGEMINHPLFREYSSAPELVMFRINNIEIMKTILDLYIIPNISKRIPETIALKFQLNDENQQLFRENREADLFKRQPISDDQFRYVVEETVLQLLCLLPTMKKNIELPESNLDILMTDKDILTINHDNAICPIHFSKNVIENKSVIDLLKFVTSTTISEVDWGSQQNPMFKKDEPVTYSVNTNTFNQTIVTELCSIDMPQSE